MNRDTEVEVLAMIDRVNDGQIVEAWVQADTLGLLRQLGAVELPNA